MKILTILSLSLITISCSSEKVSPSESAMDYVNLEVDNYWVYDWYEVSSSGETIFRESDTVQIVSDTIVQGRKVFVKKGLKFFGDRVVLIFDSANTIFSYPEREMLFTIDQNQEKVFNIGSENDPLLTATYRLSEEELIEVPIGTFQCKNWKGTFVPNDPDYEYGVRHNDNYYAKNVGLVKLKTNFYYSPNDLEARLISYGKLDPQE